MPIAKPGHAPVPASSGGTLVKDAAVTLASRIGAVVLSLGVAAASAWLLGPAGRGELAICLVFGQVLVLGLGLGVEMGCAFHAGRRPEDLGDVLGAMLVAALATGTVIVVVGLGSLRFPLPFVQKVASSALVLAVVFASAQLLFVLTSTLLMGIGRLTAFNLARLGNQALTLVGIVAVCGITRSVTHAVAAYAVGSLAAAIALVAVLARDGLLRQIRVSWRMLGACYRYGIKYYFGKLATLIDVQVGVIVMAMIGTTEQAGLFAAALGLVSRLWILPESLNIVMLPRVLRGQEALAEPLVRSCRIALLIVALGACLLALFARPVVIVVLSPAFLPAVAPMLVLLPGALAACVTKVLVSYFNGSGRPELTSITLLVGLVLNTSLVILLLPRWGLVGAATATSLAYGVEAVLAMLLFVRLTGRGWVEFLPRVEDLRMIRSRLSRGKRLEIDADPAGRSPE